jgi:hypothetical protein
MKAVEFVTEGAKVNIDVDGVVSQIRRNCQPFLSQTQQPIWRGMSRARNTKLFDTVETSAYRAPRDTPDIINTYICSWLKKTFNIPFRKEHTLFATGSSSEAGGYGISFAVFPIGEFQYCWSPRYKDLTDEFLSMQNKQFTALEIQQTVNDTMTVGDYVLNKDLDRAVSSRNEIMIYCKSYYIVDVRGLMENEGWYGSMFDIYQNLIFGTEPDDGY